MAVNAKKTEKLKIQLGLNIYYITTIKSSDIKILK